MLKLTLLRHAKSSWDYPELVDFLRPLNRRGYRQSTRLAEGFPSDVDVIWCSSAVRAYSTAQGLLNDIPELAEKLVIRGAIYEASVDTLIGILRKGGELNHIALIGHNPGLELLASYLSDSQVTMKTAHNVCLEIQCDNWKKLEMGCADIVSLWRPNE